MARLQIDQQHPSRPSFAPCRRRRPCRSCSPEPFTSTSGRSARISSNGVSSSNSTTRSTGASEAITVARAVSVCSGRAGPFSRLHRIVGVQRQRPAGRSRRAPRSAGGCGRDGSGRNSHWRSRRAGRGRARRRRAARPPRVSAILRSVATRSSRCSMPSSSSRLTVAVPCLPTEMPAVMLASIAASGSDAPAAERNGQAPRPACRRRRTRRRPRARASADASRVRRGGPASGPWPSASPAPPRRLSLAARNVRRDRRRCRRRHRCGWQSAPHVRSASARGAPIGGEVGTLRIGDHHASGRLGPCERAVQHSSASTPFA